MTRKQAGELRRLLANTSEFEQSVWVAPYNVGRKVSDLTNEQAARLIEAIKRERLTLPVAARQQILF